MSDEPVLWTSCLRCLRRFSFPLCRRSHPVLCDGCRAIVPAMDPWLGNAGEVPDARA